MKRGEVERRKKEEEGEERRRSKRRREKEEKRRRVKHSSLYQKQKSDSLFLTRLHFHVGRRLTFFMSDEVRHVHVR